MMRNDNYIVLNGWMINVLNLKGNELLVYALIYGFSQDGETQFTGSLSYVCDWLKCSRPTAIKAIDGLVQRGLIFKETVEVNRVKFNRYKVNLQVVKNLYYPSKEILPPPSKKTLHNNTNKDNTNNKHIYGEFKHVRLSDTDISKLKKLTNDVEGWIKRLDEYIENKGAKYKNHYLTLRNWIGREKPKQNDLPDWYDNIPSQKANSDTLARALEFQKELKKKEPGLPD